MLYASGMGECLSFALRRVCVGLTKEADVSDFVAFEHVGSMFALLLLIVLIISLRSLHKSVK